MERQKKVKVLSTVGLLVFFLLFFGILIVSGKIEISLEDIKPIFFRGFTDYAQGEGNHSYTSADGLTYSTNDNGIIRVIKNNETIGKFGFAIIGKINDVKQIKTSEDYTWTWSKSNYSDIIEDYNETIDEFFNTTYEVKVFTAYNNQANFNWTQVWEFHPLKPAKIKNIITNNLGTNITNTTFWYVNKLNEGDRLFYDGIGYTLSEVGDTHLQGNFNNASRKLDFYAYEFRFQDLISSGFTITDFYEGNGSIVGHPETYIVGIGVSKGDGILRDEVTIELDPAVTGFKSPANTGSPSNQWTNGANIKTSNDVYTTETTIGHKLDTSIYNFGIDAGSTIHGIFVKVEGDCDVV